MFKKRNPQRQQLSDKPSHNRRERRPPGPIQGRSCSTLPLRHGDRRQDRHGRRTAVVFDSVDYAVDEPVSMNVVGDNIVLFDAQAKVQVGIGSLEFA